MQRRWWWDSLLSAWVLLGSVGIRQDASGLGSARLNTTAFDFVRLGSGRCGCVPQDTAAFRFGDALLGSAAFGYEPTKFGSALAGLGCVL